MLLTDDETGSYWNHMTGACVHGPMRGAQLPVWGIEHTTVRRALARWPGLTLASGPTGGLWQRMASGFLNLMGRRRLKARGFLPPGFRSTMGTADPRLPEFTQGLGVISAGSVRFYAFERIAEPVVETWLGGRVLRVCMDADGIPRARWDDGGVPMQLMARWYGFSLAYPGCSVFGDDAEEVRRAAG